ncbi:PREDICTED: uncharacterized protein LOC104708722 [Camelina sativa]|uniref:Uncharacterized protein LOC104708722 n=1 Tax=Camelina sativa TaxID=90675 RepID=A0ABM0TBB0_CAMSA|nr:PREDICTED: uncharacterized protein LOC104708722 [Camelina sativa]
MALRMINHVRLLLVAAALVVMVVASVARESLSVDSPPVKQDLAKRDDTIWEEVFLEDHGSWSPTPTVRGEIRIVTTWCVTE